MAPLLLTFSTRALFAALGRTGPVLVASLIAVVFNALANYAFIFGHFGAPALGIFGSGLATSLSHLLMFSLLVGYSFLDPRTRSVGLFSHLWRFHAASLAQLWRLGLPIGGTIAAEISVFSLSALAMGLIGPELDRGARDRRPDRRHHVHGPTRARAGRERARRPRVRRARSGRGLARGLDSVRDDDGFRRRFRGDDVRVPASLDLAVHRDGGRQPTPRS